LEVNNISNLCCNFTHAKLRLIGWGQILRGSTIPVSQD
jgi:hypothetical protein